ncbi:hypothetical protein SCHPADRAFT_873886 [Schizopora paradoxa]|uniref:BTB domain-containing protein n=1 Tax=Schizopora paradoxa TaxID=27342 RepID=A0A0H2RP31_9AGAM|nr:hypothetical protein SCHPADRAFT_873886 [Schizopora paradoxa]
MKHASEANDVGDLMSQCERNDEGERHPSLWFEDGNIIVSAKSAETQKLMLFRVHKSVLSRQSSVFAGLFSLPDTPENYGGPEDLSEIPTVFLADDAEGIADLFNILYGPQGFNLFTRKRNPDFPLQGMKLLKIADKYELDAIKNAIVSRMSTDWPKSLEEWDTIDANGALFEGNFIRRSDWPEELIPEPISAAILAKEGKITDIMAATFYDVYRSYRFINWDNPGPTGVDTSYSHKGARWALATPEHLRKLLLIQEIIDRTLAQNSPFVFLQGAVGEGIEGCQTAHICQPLVAKKAFEVVGDIWDSRDPLALLRQFIDWSNGSILCPFCKAEILDQASVTRTEIWEKVRRVAESDHL